MKKYFIGFISDKCHYQIVANTDNLKPFIIYINGSQYGNNYKTLGHCSQALYRWYEGRKKRDSNIMMVWGDINVIPAHGSNIDWFNRAYKGEE
jgi:hypothetical protein